MLQVLVHVPPVAAVGDFVGDLVDGFVGARGRGRAGGVAPGSEKKVWGCIV